MSRFRDELKVIPAHGADRCDIRVHRDEHAFLFAGDVLQPEDWPTCHQWARSF